MSQPGHDHVGNEAFLVADDEFKAATGESIERTLDLRTWHVGVDLGALYHRLEAEVGPALEQERRVQNVVRTDIFPLLREAPDAPTEAGVHQAAPADLEDVHRKVLFSGQLDSCDGTSLTHDRDGPDSGLEPRLDGPAGLDDGPEGDRCAMAEMAMTHAASPEVRELAGNIKQAQQPEIDQMTEWLKAWGAQVPSTSTAGMGGTDHGGGGSMPGMMSAEQMNQMGQASGAQFDRMFLQMMIEHHEGAIEMAQAEVNDGENSDAQQLAQKIITDQQAEITQMQALLQKV
jgi:uncharacterized protein (DUF305 family)